MQPTVLLESESGPTQGNQGHSQVRSGGPHAVPAENLKLLAEEVSQKDRYAERDLHLGRAHFST